MLLVLLPRLLNVRLVTICQGFLVVVTGFNDIFTVGAGNAVSVRVLGSNNSGWFPVVLLSRLSVWVGWRRVTILSVRIGGRRLRISIGVGGGLRRRGGGSSRSRSRSGGGGGGLFVIGGVIATCRFLSVIYLW